MKFSININQKSIIDNFDDIDLVDASLVDWFSFFSSSGKMEKIVIEDEIYFWVDYKAVIKQMPLLGLNSRDSVYRRFQKLTQNSILKLHKKSRMSKTYFAPDRKFDLLFYSEKSAKSSDTNPNQFGYKSELSSDTNPNSSMEDNSINNNSINDDRPPSKISNEIIKGQIQKLLNKNYKNKDKLGKVQHTTTDWPSYIVKFSDWWVGQGRTARPSGRRGNSWDKGVLTSFEFWDELEGNYAESTPSQTYETQLNQIRESYSKVFYTKIGTFWDATIVKLMKGGFDFEGVEHLFRHIKKNKTSDFQTPERLFGQKKILQYASEFTAISE